MCVTCKINFPSENFLQRHLRIDHNACRGCGSLFTMAGLKRHQEVDPLCKMIVSSGDYGETLSKTCEFCDQLVIVNERAEHYQSHKFNLACRQCIFCSLKFATPPHYRSHLPCSISCSICGKKLQLNRWLPFKEVIESFRAWLFHLETCWAAKIRELEESQSAIDFGEINISYKNPFIMLNIKFLYLALFTPSNRILNVVS